MTHPIDLFPLGVATGAAHCNRVEERQQLQDNILGGTHTWLSARRRMGKTSLIEQVIEDLTHKRRKIVTLTIDLLVVHDAPELERRLRRGVERLATEILPRGQKATAKLANAFEKLNPRFSVGTGGVGIQLGLNESPVQSIEDMLMALDAAAGEYRRRVVLVLDEFQQLSEMKDESVRLAAEGAIRHAVERARNITYLFAGTQKHLLAPMFEHEDRPLYRLCRKVSLERISVQAYVEFLRDASYVRWRKRLHDDQVHQILVLTARHPYYVNALCARLWEGKARPSEDRIYEVWELLIEEDRSLVSGKVLRLSAAQRAVLKGIANHPEGVAQPTSTDFLSSIRLPTSTGSRAKEILEQQDFIQLDDTGAWILVDPVMAYYLRTL